MIRKTTTTINGIEYDYTYSDAGKMIERDGEQYESAIDPLNSGRVYIETDIDINGDIENPSNDGEISGEEFLDMMNEVL